MGKSLEGKIAIVTGAASGIGKTFSIGLASAGAKVVVVDVGDVTQTLADVEAAGGLAMGLKADVSSQSDVERMVKSVIDAHGRVDILVNNAGIYPIQPIEEVSLSDWRRVMGVNLDGVFLCSKEVVPHMKRQSIGRIINITSTTFFMGMPNLTHYIASKGGVIGFTRSLAAELGDFGITVNCIAPGLTKTPSVESSDDLLGIWDQLVASQCIKRKQTPDDLLGPLLFLASEDAAFVTGQTLNVDGGLTRH